MVVKEGPVGLKAGYHGAPHESAFDRLRFAQDRECRDTLTDLIGREEGLQSEILEAILHAPAIDRAHVRDVLHQVIESKTVTYLVRVRQAALQTYADMRNKECEPEDRE